MIDINSVSNIESCENTEELNNGMKEFVSLSKMLVLFKVFTNVEKDADVVKSVLGNIKSSRSGKAMLKQIVKRIIGR